MRVITGTARGRKLREPSDNKIRPTTDMVKEAIFNIVQFDIEGRAVLDLFAGTGQLGIEALSRGAESAVFVDESAEAVKLVGANLRNTGLEQRAQVIQGDSMLYLRGARKFDVIFLDPPYETTLLDKALSLINQFDILKGNGIIVCESKREKEMLAVSQPYRMLREYVYGRIKLTTYTRIVESTDGIERSEV